MSSINFPVDSSGLVFSGSIGSLSITGTAATSTSDYAYSKTYYDTSYNEINTRVNNDITNLSNNYYTKNNIDSNFYNKTTIDNNFNSLNCDKLISGTVSVARGGTGQNSLTSGLILIGNGTSGILQNSNLSWDNTNSRLGIKKTPTSELDVNGTITCTNIASNGSALTNLNASNVSSGVLSLSRGGLGVSSLTANQIFIGNGSASILQSSNLIWDNTNNRLGINKNPANSLDVSGNISCNNFIGIGSSITSLNAPNISTGTLAIAQGGTGLTTFSAGQILIGNGSSLLQTNKLFYDTSNNRLGIGNSNPTNTLHVTGDTRINF